MVDCKQLQKTEAPVANSTIVGLDDAEVGRGSFKAEKGRVGQLQGRTT